MANAFTNFLSSVGDGIFGNVGNLKDYQHADRLFVRNNYLRAPKFGFLYYVTFDINDKAIKDSKYLNRKGPRDVGFLVKRTDLPSFEISTETNNQYNRKTVVQTKLNYSTINLDFHDDNGDISTNLWKNYYSYYYADGTYGSTQGSKSGSKEVIKEFSDTKYGVEDYSYGYSNIVKDRFFNAINIYVLHRGKGVDFTHYILVNPTVLSWNHDNLDSSDGNKILSNKMRIAYESVIYREGKIKKNLNPPGFATIYYDTSPSPLSVAGGGTKTLLGSGGVLAGVGDIFGAVEEGNFLGAALLARNTVKNAQQLTKGGLKSEGLSVLNGVLGNIQATGNQPGGIGAAIQTGAAQSGLGVLGAVGVTLFSDKNSSTTQQTKGTPRKITGGG